jgi:integrase
LLRPPLLGLFRFAVRRGYLEANLVKLTDVERKPHQVLEDAPEKALSPQQVTLYFAHLEQHEPELYPLVYVQFCLGCRFAEVSSLRHEDVDLETGLVKIRRGQYRGVEGGTKGKYARRAGLPSSAVELIRRHAQRMSVERWPGWRELVFPRPLSGSRRGSNFWAASTADGKIREAYKRLGFPLAGATTHVARHTLISIANTLEQMPSGLLKTVVGHKTDQVHALYNRPPDENVLALGERLGQALTGSETGSFTKPKRKKPTK